MNVSRNAPCPCGSGRKYKVCCLTKEAVQRKPRRDQDALIVCMPTRGQITFETELALRMNLQGIEHLSCMVARRPVVEARNQLARLALEAIDANPLSFVPREWYVLWVDDDAWWQPGTVEALMNGMHQDRTADIVFAMFGARTPYAPPFAYRDASDSESYLRLGIDYQFGQVVPIETAGFHFVLMRASALQKVGPDPFTLRADHGEDYEFCSRAREAGLSLKAATGVPIVHLDPRDGTAYMPGMPAMMMDGNILKALTTQHATASGTNKAETRDYGIAAMPNTTEADREAEARLSAEMEQRRKVSAL